MSWLQTRKRIRRTLQVFASVLLLIIVSVSSYSCSVQRQLSQEMVAADRDPLTSVIRGTEAITLTPPPGTERTPRTVVLMIHGFLSARSDFGDLGERLAKQGVTVRLMRLPGHGTTPIEFANLTDGALYRAVEQEYANLRDEYDRFYVVGFSMGGSLATILAARERVDKIVLLAPYYAVAHQWYYVLPAMTWNHLLGWAVPYIRRPESFVKINDRSQVGKYFMYHTMPTAGVRQLEKLGIEASKPETLHRISCPVLLVHSVDDEAASPDAARRAFSEFPSLQKEEMWVKRSNHVLLWDYDREEIMQRIEHFILKDLKAPEQKR